MWGWLLPSKEDFFNYYENLMSIIVQGAEELFALISEEQTDPLTKANRIKELRCEAENLTHQCIEALHKTFITPFQRDDLYRLVSQMNKIIDVIEDTSARIVIYKLHKMSNEARKQAQILVKITKELEKTLMGLRNLRGIEHILQSFVDIKFLTKEASSIQLDALAKLFNDEEETLLMIIKCKEIYENLARAINLCKDVSNTIEGVILESC